MKKNRRKRRTVREREEEGFRKLFPEQQKGLW